MTKREAEERRLEKRARKIGRLDTRLLGDRGWAWMAMLWVRGKGFDRVSGSGPTRLAALRDLLRRVDRFADKVVKSREGE